MSRTHIPEGYRPLMGLYETQMEIGAIKRVFEDKLAVSLNLKRVSAPLFVQPQTGLNDNLSGVERPVSFDLPAADCDAQVVQSLAKWKRMALHRYGFEPGVGLYTDMNAIRRDEAFDNFHSAYVDQWDWERVLADDERNETALKRTVRTIAGVIADTAQFLRLPVRPEREVTFVTSQQLEDLFPALTPEQRENAFVKEHPTTFVLQIGGALRSGQPHGSRSPDYDDWTLNGDLLYYNELHDSALELSSMGIRVDAATLDRQLTLSGCDDRRTLAYHKMLLAGQLPQTIGGGIGQSRLCMLLLQKAHIGEVQVSVWDDETVQICQQQGITLL